MTAIGLVMVIIGIWAAQMDPFSRSMTLAVIAVVCYYGGVLVALAGIAMWLWRVAP